MSGTERWERKRIKRAQRGDRKAFAELYEAHASALFSRILYPRLGNRQAAEDALAETFRSALERLGQYQERGSGLWPWLVRIAINKANDIHRSHARSDRALASFEHLVVPLCQQPQGPDRAVEESEVRALVQERVSGVLAVINPRYRRAIELRFLKERERADCAEMMEVKLGTFDVLILRALRAFRKEWDKQAEQDETRSSDG